MPWRLHLTNRAIPRLDIMPNAPQSLLAAWTQPGRVAYFDLQTGAALGERRFSDFTNRLSDSWLGFLEELKAPTGAYPPVIPAAGLTVYLDSTGERRLHHLASGEVRLLSNGRDLLLSGEAHILAAGFDRAHERVVMLDSAGKLHLRPQDAEVGVHDVGLPALDLDLFLAVAAADSGESCFVVYDRSLLKIDSKGQVARRLELHYPVGAFACSPDGRLLVCSDRETNVIRVYDADFTPLHQRHAADLMARATQVQLIADPPPSMITLNTLAAADDGTLSFALAGVVCVTDVTQMLAFPRQVVEPDREP